MRERREDVGRESGEGMDGIIELRLNRNIKVLEYNYLEGRLTQRGT
jgi:hypothetical protein